ncbi:MAG: hypothetical protein AB7Q29_11850 [Vicinamibacterales bacterium]
MSGITSRRRLSFSPRGPLFWLLGGMAVAGTLQCARPAETVLDCAASDIHHILHIAASGRQVEDRSFTPAKRGEAEVSDAEYVLRFVDSRDDYELIFRIDRATGRGIRVLIDNEGVVPRGHGGSDEIACTTYTAPR